MEEKCGQCHYFNSKDGICRNKQMQKECFQGDKDNILYVSRGEQKCALFKAKVKGNRQLTPEILTAAGWENSFQYTAGGDKLKRQEKRIDDNRITIIYHTHGSIHIFNNKSTMDISKKQITVGEFNTLLDIVGLSKFQIK